MLKLAVRKMVTNIKAGGEKNGRKNMNGCVMLNWDDVSKFKGDLDLYLEPTYQRNSGFLHVHMCETCLIEMWRVY